MDVLNLPVSGSVLSPDNLCVTDFAVLREFNLAEFSVYREHFDEINRIYALYQRDITNLGKDPKELLSMESGEIKSGLLLHKTFRLY